MAALANIFGIGFCLFGIYILLDPEIVWRYQESLLRNQGVKYTERPDNVFYNHPRLAGVGYIILGLFTLWIFR